MCRIRKCIIDEWNTREIRPLVLIRLLFFFYAMPTRPTLYIVCACMYVCMSIRTSISFLNCTIAFGD